MLSLCVTNGGTEVDEVVAKWASFWLIGVFKGGILRCNGVLDSGLLMLKDVDVDVEDCELVDTLDMDVEVTLSLIGVGRFRILGGGGGGGGQGWEYWEGQGGGKFPAATWRRNDVDAT